MEVATLASDEITYLTTTITYTTQIIGRLKMRQTAMSMHTLRAIVYVSADMLAVAVAPVD